MKRLFVSQPSLCSLSVICCAEAVQWTLSCFLGRDVLHVGVQGKVSVQSISILKSWTPLPKSLLTGWRITIIHESDIILWNFHKIALRFLFIIQNYPYIVTYLSPMFLTCLCMTPFALKSYCKMEVLVKYAMCTWLWGALIITSLNLLGITCSTVGEVQLGFLQQRSVTPLSSSVWCI